MNVLWITNIALPPICRELGGNVPPVGGWMYSSLERMHQEYPDINFAVATVYAGKRFITSEISGIKYFLLPLKGHGIARYNRHLEPLWREIKQSFKPDVIHIHGSEFPHGLAYVHACGSAGVVVSIQGIISCYARYYAAGIEFRDVKKYVTLRDIFRRSNIIKDQLSFESRGVLEKELLKLVNHVIGRTDWDKAHTWTINPEADYHYCGETLRKSFYGKRWQYSECEPFSIFISQASYPIKGLHILLHAMPLILNAYPDTKIYVSGFDQTGRPWWLISWYGKYLKDLIKKYRLDDHIEFLGMLNEEEMCRRFLKSNVFVCPSSIENSPNSLGEAQLLEMPYIASYVGGVPEIVNGNPDVLYRFEEYEMLAQKVINVFNAGSSFKPFKFDYERYDSDGNMKTMIKIYNCIASKCR